MPKWQVFPIFAEMNHEDKIKGAVRLKLTQYLSQNKLRKTPERYTILDKIYSLNDHLSVDDLFNALECDAYHVSRATIYNTMELLVEAGLVHKHNFGGNQSKYERVTGIANHHHLICSQCGNVKEIKDNSINKILAAQHYGKFQAQYADLQIYGICARCQKKTKKNSQKPTQ